MRKLWAMVGIAALGVLSACGKQATGQVVAVVNGEELSLSELNGELLGAPRVTGAERQQLANAALQRLIDRKLLVQQARQRNIDKDPEYLRQQRRMNDDLLISLLGKQVGGNVGVPGASAIDKFIVDNPLMFAQRTIYNLDQIVFEMPADRSMLKRLESDHSMAAVAAKLGNMKIEFARAPAALDSATVPKELIGKVLSLPQGEPFVVTNGNKAFVSVIVGQQSQPIASAGGRATAAEAIRRNQLTALAAKQLREARAAAKIDYQPEYSPAAAPKERVAAKAPPAP